MHRQLGYLAGDAPDRGRQTQWNFARSDAGGDRASAIYSVVKTAKLHGLESQHLRHGLKRIADHPVSRVADLLP